MGIMCGLIVMTTLSLRTTRAIGTTRATHLSKWKHRTWTLTQIQKWQKWIRYTRLSNLMKQCTCIKANLKFTTTVKLVLTPTAELVLLKE